MPIEFKMVDGIIVLHMSGDYSTADLRNAVLDAIDATGSSNPIGMLFNVSESDALKKRSAEEVTAMGFFLASQSDRFGRRIALIGSDDFLFGMMRIGSAALQQENVRNQVFRTEAEGLAWLRPGAAG